jgi:hypothetical protein
MMTSVLTAWIVTFALFCIHHSSKSRKENSLGILVASWSPQHKGDEYRSSGKAPNHEQYELKIVPEYIAHMVQKHKQ